jgi:hypothetical protein
MEAVAPESTGVAAGPSSHQRLARLTGVLYLLLAVCGMFAPLVLQSLVVPGDAATTAGNILGARGLFAGSLVVWIAIVILDIALAVALHLLLEPVGRALSLVTAAIRLAYAAILGTLLVYLFDAFLLLSGTGRGVGLDGPQRQALALSALETFSTGFLLAIVFFGAHLVALGCLLFRSRTVPRLLGMLVVAGGVGYIADSLASFFAAGYGGPMSVVFLAPAVVGELGLAGWLLVKGIKVWHGAARPTATKVRVVGATGGTR